MNYLRHTCPRSVLLSSANAACIGRTIGLRAARRASSEVAAERFETTLPQSFVPTDQPFHRLSRTTTASLLRSWCLSKILSSQILSKSGLALLKHIAKSNGSLLNAERNTLLRRILKTCVYDQFCAGSSEDEVRQTVAAIKRQGYSGVVLSHAREIQPEGHGYRTSEVDAASQTMEDIEQWRKRNLETIALMGSSDVLSIKVTGAGERVTQSLIHWTPFPEQFRKAIREICNAAQTKGCRVWIDAEQQHVQDGIDQLATDLMRLYNTGSKPVVYNTLQAYLKDARLRMHRQLQLSVDEGWTLAIKLVRGAYLDTDDRRRMHDTKADTDASYNEIARGILHHAFPGYPLCAAGRPALELVLAGHNRKSISDACDLARRLDAAGSLRTKPEFAQLQGMADDIGNDLLNAQPDVTSKWRPCVYKYLTWGSMQDCMLYLVRRAQENQGATHSLLGGSEVFAELKRRLLNNFRSYFNHYA